MYHRMTALMMLVLAGLLSVESVQSAEPLADVLSRPLLPPGNGADQHAKFILKHIPSLELAPSADEWSQRASLLRERVLADVVFRGVPEEWYQSPPDVVWMDEIKTPHGYSIKKLRYEALPGLWIPAILYVPDQLEGEVPVVLNVNGHSADGKATDYKQLRCINLAKRGMLALNPEWLYMGQLRAPGYAHNHLALLDLCGTSGLSVFYLAMSRGIDVLLSLEHADSQRVAVTGLSGGGWQTIILSSLDERVTLSVPVAGYSALAERVEHRGSIGDLEQNPNDLVSIADYSHLTAMMVPRPTLQIYNAQDNCCFVSSHVKPNTHDPIIPFFEQAGAKDRFEYYENSDPGTHNYEVDNRQQLYRFLNKHFYADDQTRSDREIPSQEEIMTADELFVPLPEDNATFHSLAENAARDLPRSLEGKSLDERRALLKTILRYEAHEAESESVEDAIAFDGGTIARFHLRVGDDWTLPVSVVTGKTVKRTTILLADDGIKSQAETIDRLVKEGTRVVCVDPIFMGEMQATAILYQGPQMAATVGRRPLGIQADQILNVAVAFGQWLDLKKLDVIAVGPRAGIAALCAAALDESGIIVETTTAELPDSLKAFLKPDAAFDKTPEMYCFGLLQSFDISDLKALQTGKK